MLVGDAGDLWITKDGKRRIIGKWFKLRCNCMLVWHTWSIE